MLLSGSLLLLLAAGQLARPASCARARLNRTAEPQAAQVAANYWLLVQGRPFVHLAAAGLDARRLPGAHSFTEDHGAGRRSLPPDTAQAAPPFEPADFRFRSSHWMRKASTLTWLVPYAERAALQVFDRAQDRTSARGPQVDERACALHLDYLAHMARGPAAKLASATELSVFTTLASFDTPRLGVATGNALFLGSYAVCLANPINVLRHQLEQLNSSAAKHYFEQPKHAHESQQLEPAATPLSAWELAGLLVGRPPQSRQPAPSLAQHPDKLRMVATRYCLAHIRWPQWPNSSFYERNFALRVAVCLPASCDSSALHAARAQLGPKIEALMRTQMADPLYQGFYLHDLYCLPDEQSHFRRPLEHRSTALFAALIASWLLATIAASLADLLLPPAPKHRPPPLWRSYLSCWSLYANVRAFFRLREPAAPTSGRPALDTKPLDGMRILSSASVIFAHSVVVIFTNVWNIDEGHRLISSTYLTSIESVCPFVVDNFIVITGVMTSRALFADPKTRASLTGLAIWAKFLLFRYLRIMPFYLLATLFLKTSFRFLSQGPLWDYGTSLSAWSRVCQAESLWTVLSGTANFHSPAAGCLGVGWYLANDLQFALITPIFVAAFAHKPRLGHAITLGAALLAASHHVLYYLAAPQPARFDFSMMTLTAVLDDTYGAYVMPHFRVGPYLIGLSLGHYLYQFELGQTKRPGKRAILLLKLYPLLGTYLLYVFPALASILPADQPRLVHTLVALYAGLVHSATAIGTGCVIFLLCTGELPALAKFLRSPMLLRMARTTLSVTIFHLPIIFYHEMSQTTLSDLSEYNILVKSLFWIFESYLLAIPIHLIFEVPLRRFTMRLVFGIDQTSNYKATARSLDRQNDDELSGKQHKQD